MPELRGKRGGAVGPKQPRSASPGGPEREAPKKKNLRLHQSKIDEAKAILGTATETETIETALDLVVFRKELVEGVRTMRGTKLVNLFDTARE
jgi:hypothetical protein